MAEIRQAKRLAKTLYLGRPGVVAVYIGVKQVGGRSTGEEAVVFGVEKKLDPQEVPEGQMLPKTFVTFPTDVVEVGKIVARGLTQRKRPCPGGYSVGHYRITAGTLGAWVKRGTSELYHILSNNHVLANSNVASLGDPIYQPGSYDGGGPQDVIATLSAYVKINYDGESGGGGKKNKKMWLWSVAKAIPNFIARVVGCPYRLAVARPLEIPQPYPNLVDAAVAAAGSSADVDPHVEFVGAINGIRDLRLGDRVQKVGRTTGRTYGQVVGVEGSVRVDYGGPIATFEHQIIIGPGGFSAGGDSGSVILTEDGYLGGLLYAGSNTTTIANRISDVLALTGVRLP